MKIAPPVIVTMFLAACGHPAGSADDGPGPDAGSAAPDAATAHVGGWRMRGGDGSLAYRSPGAGPQGAAAMTVAYQNPSADEFAGLGTPIVDEDGNVYVVATTPMQPSALVSLAASGAMRWNVALEQGWSYGELALGPDGDLYAVATTGSGATAQAKLVGFDGKTGAALAGAAPIAGLARILMPADGTIYALTYTEAAGYGMQALPSMGAAPRWTKPQGGDAYAIAPDGSALAMVVVGAGNPAPPYDVVSLDPATGNQRWHYTLDVALASSPVIAIDSDGAVYVAASKNGSGLHLLKLSPTGAVVWDLLADSVTYPSRILIGPTTVSVSCQTPSYYGAGFTVDKSTAAQPANWSAPCGEPEAVDAHDTIYWACDGGIQAANAAGQPVGGWSGNYTFQVVLAPSSTAYAVPAAYFADHQLFRIR